MRPTGRPLPFPRKNPNRRTLWTEVPGRSLPSGPFPPFFLPAPAGGTRAGRGDARGQAGPGRVGSGRPASVRVGRPAEGAGSRGETTRDAGTGRGRRRGRRAGRGGHWHWDGTRAPPRPYRAGPWRWGRDRDHEDRHWDRPQPRVPRRELLGLIMPVL